MKKSLGLRLFLSYGIVLLVGVAVLVIVTQLSLPRAFGRHLGMMVGDGQGMMMGQGREPGDGGGINQGLYDSFRGSFNDALIWAVLAASAAAVVVSLLVTRGISAPLHRMTVASQRISQGRYEERVPVVGEDELGRLASSFNSMAEKLEQTEIRRRQLIGDVAHELRTPLTAIKGSMEGLSDGVLPATPETFDLIRHEADRLSRLVDDLQEVSRVESSAFKLDLKSVALPDLVEAALRRLSRPFEAKGVSLASELPTALPHVLADADRITQVLINLLGNALQYTPQGGRVTVSAVTYGRQVQVSVNDNGIGIPPEHLPHIFDRFYRVDKSRSRREGGGSGVGLTIAKTLVEAHGGKMWVESPGENMGSTFIFTLPLAM